MLRSLFRRTPRAQVEPTVDSAERIYAIGDVHGRADLLAEMIEMVHQDADRRADGRRTQIVLLGDYIDRGDRSAEVLAQVGALREAGAVCLMGNHEAALLAFVDDPVRDSAWLEFGGLQTLGAYNVAPPGRTDAGALQKAAAQLTYAMGPHLDLLRQRLTLCHQSGNVVFVHAALDPKKTLDKQSPNPMMWGYSAFLAHGWREDAVVVHGHYAADEVVAMPGRICIDTGAYYTNRLTALRLDDEVGTLQTGRR